MLKRIVKELQKPINLFLILILVVGFAIRVWNLNYLLNFYFDQGRDALVIWDLIHKGKLFLIGPTTGLAGVFRGPYYYYLITPFYLLGRGNPVWPTVFLAFTTVVAILMIYILGKKIQDERAGVIAAVIASFSFYIVYASRWLSNPTPMLLLSMILVWAMVKVTEHKKWAWPIIAVVSGLSLFNFGSSGEFFYFPAIAIFIVWQWKNRPDLKNFTLSVILFILTFAPLVLFDIKHDHILLNNFLGTFGGDSGSFKIPTLDFIKSRNLSYFDIFTNKIFQDRKSPELIVLIITVISSLVFLPKLIKKTGVKIVLLLLGSVVVGLYFYQGNFGVLYDYYITGYYLIFILLFAIVIANISRIKILGPIFLVYFFYLFFMNNLPVLKSKITDESNGAISIALKNQLQAIDWIYKDANKSDFNVDVYVPPVIPYAYDYLFQWLGTYKYNQLSNTDKNVSLLYTLYEVDPPHPERLKAWMDRQKSIGKVESEEKFGGITVQRRARLKYE